MAILFLLSPDTATTITHEPTTTTRTPLHAYTTLQTHLHTTPSLYSLCIPTLLISSPLNLASVVQLYMQSLRHSLPPLPVPPPPGSGLATPITPLSLLRTCTTSAPPRLLSEHTAFVITDFLDGFAALAALVSGEKGVVQGVSEGGEMDGMDGLQRVGGREGRGDRDRGGIQESLHGLVEKEELDALADFWREEWVVE